MNISYNDNLFCQMLRFHNVYHRCLCFIFDQTTTDGPRTKVSKNTLLFTYSTNILVRFRWGQGAGARENRGREGYGRREKKGREAGSLRWREAEEKFKKASFRYLLLLTSSQRNEPNKVS